MREIEWVLHTHHHRDQCQGDHLLAERGIPIAVPEREAALFAETDAFWRLKRIYDNYDVSGIGFTLPRPVRVVADAPRLRDVRVARLRHPGPARRPGTPKAPSPSSPRSMAWRSPSAAT